MMKQDVFGLIYTGESNMQLKELTYSRSVAAMPFGGRNRCIDFIMSSIVNTGINNVGLIVQKDYHSLIDHLGSGKEWDLHRKKDGLFLLPPFVTHGNIGLYRGTVDALSGAMGYIRRSAQSYVLLTGSHTVFNATFDDMIKQHMETGADITIMYNECDTPPGESCYDDMRMDTDSSGRITDLVINRLGCEYKKRSCDVFLMEKKILEELIEDARSHVKQDFVRDILISKMDELKLYGYRYDGYVARMDSLEAYYRHSMDILKPEVRRDLFNPEHPIYTKVKDEASARYGSSACVKNSMVADGCIIEGTVENSILFRGVKVGKGAVIKNAIIMQANDIGKNVELDCVISDKSVIIKDGRKLIGIKEFPMVIKKGSVV